MFRSVLVRHRLGRPRRESPRPPGEKCYTTSGRRNPEPSGVKLWPGPLPTAAAQAPAHLPPRLGAAELAEQHGDELPRAGEAARMALRVRPLHQCLELGARKELEELAGTCWRIHSRVSLLRVGVEAGRPRCHSASGGSSALTLQSGQECPIICYFEPIKGSGVSCSANTFVQILPLETGEGNLAAASISIDAGHPEQRGAPRCTSPVGLPQPCPQW